MSLAKEPDLLDLEFQYYCSSMEDLFCLLRNKCEQFLAVKWNHKLTEPLYNVGDLRKKRNHYLLMLGLCLNLGELVHPFNKAPPSGVLPEINSIQKSQRYCNFTSSPPEKQQKPCDFHENDACPFDSDNISKVLDEQFAFVSQLAERYIEKMADVSDRRRANLWIKFLSSIDTRCFHMKGVRNDYAMLLSGYALHDELVGPFLQIPIEKLVPLEDLVKTIDMNNHMVIDPSHPRAVKFLKDVPLPEEGAFAFLAVTGNIVNSDN